MPEMLAVDKLRALYQRAGMSAAESNAAVRNARENSGALYGAYADEPTQALATSFNWSTSPEGDEYWRAVFMRMFRRTLA